MPWAATTPERIRAAIEGQATGFVYSQIRGGMDRSVEGAEAAFPGSGEQLIATVEGYLDLIDQYDTQIDAGSGNATLIQADVLKWSDKNSRLAGTRRERARYVRRVMDALGLSDLSSTRQFSGRIVRN